MSLFSRCVAYSYCSLAVLWATSVVAGVQFQALSTDGKLIPILSERDLSDQHLQTFRVIANNSETFTVEITRRVKSENENLVLSGAVSESGTFVLAVSAQGKVIGSLNVGYSQYHIDGQLGDIQMTSDEHRFVSRTTDAGVYQPEKIDLEPEPKFSKSLERRGVKALKFGASSAPDGPNYPQFIPKPEIAVLFFHDANLTDPELAVDYAVEYSNFVYARTNMGMTLRSAGIVSVEIDSALDNSGVLAAMINGEAPFVDLDNTRTTYRADLVHTLRINKANTEESNCGIARYAVRRGRGYRSSGLAVTEWDRCNRRTVAHEIGHNLGAAHDRDSSTIAPDNAYPYSFGQVRPAVFSTLMGVGRDGEIYLDTFSDPEQDCMGFPCGVAPTETDSADNRRTLMNASRIAASFEGEEFDPAGIQFWPYESEDASWCDNTGYRSHAVKNSTGYPINVRQHTFLREDGTTFSTRDYEAGDFVVRSGGDNGRGYCNDQLDQPFGDDIRESFMVYEHPLTGDFIEGTHLRWDDNYVDGYATINAAAGAGGSVVGNPSLHARVDGEVEVEFEPEYGFQINEIAGTCLGTLHNNVFTVTPSYGDCWVVAEFAPLNPSERISLLFKSLLGTVLRARGN